jgi:LPS O-antigen subunit length determinant protein (WzzB/FepE family)
MLKQVQLEFLLTGNTKQQLKDEIKRLENSNEINKEKKISRLEKKDTLGGINFDSVIIADFDESLCGIKGD